MLIAVKNEFIVPFIIIFGTRTFVDYGIDALIYVAV